MTDGDRVDDDRVPFWHRYRWLLAAVAAVVVALALFSVLCDEEPHAEVDSVVYEPQFGELMIGINYCGGSYATGFVETDETVSVWIYPINRRPSSVQLACKQIVQFPLAEPLGDRRVIDGRTGEPFPCCDD